MRRSLRKVGTVLFWLAWPGFWLILHGTERSRLMLVRGDELLVMKDWFYDKWALPGGGKHHGESPLDALVREVHEELSFELKTETLKPLFSEMVCDRGIKVSWDYFVADVAVKPKVKPASFIEVSEFAWLPRSQLNAANSGLDVLHGLAKYTKP